MRITINGVELTEGQVTTVHAALNSFGMELNDPHVLGDDPTGMDIARGYKARLLEILLLMTSER